MTDIRAASGFGPEAVLFNKIERGASKSDCGRLARACAITGLIARRGSLLVFGLTGRANQRSGNASAAVALAKSALAYLAVVEKRSVH